MDKLIFPLDGIDTEMTASVYSILIHHYFATDRTVYTPYTLAPIAAGFISSSCLTDLIDASQTT